MKVFTYGQYIKCIHTLRLNAVLQLAEESTLYNLNKLKEVSSRDKLVKNLLQNKEEIVEIINQFLEPREKVEAENLVRYTNSYMIKKYKLKETNLIYKLKNKEVFFLIEHQAIIDNSISYKILNYCLDIMKEWNRSKEIRKVYSYPIIVPIVIYTGNQKWKIEKEVKERNKEKQISNYVFENYKVNLEYNLIDINKIPKQNLEKIKSKLQNFTNI